jgi:3-deoxy-D-manno-octulosonic-acid transferase
MTEIRQKNRPPEPAMLKIYAGLTAALTPLLHLSKPLLSVYGGFKDTVPERLGKFSPVLDDLAARTGNHPLVFIHAVSVGEASVAKALVDAIRERRDDALTAISTTTFTGRDYILRNFEPDALFFFPLDLPDVMRRLVDKLHPDCFIDIEVELWPNLFRALSDAGVPMALANGRISDRAAHPPAFLRSLYGWLYGSLDALFMRSNEDVERIIALGAPEDRTYLAGNLKFAACGIPPDASEREKTRSILGLGENAKLLVAGSTHPGEDEQIIDAWLDLEKNPPPGTDSIHLVLAPRHLEQVKRITDLVLMAGRKVALWTQIKESGQVPEGARAVVVDTIGELMRLYGAADAAFVGGSLVTRGGHNVLEPVAMGVPTVHGPSMANFHDLKKVLSDAGLLIEVENSKELADAVRRCIAEIDRDEYRSRARELIENQQLAADMIADWVAEVLPKS